MSTRMMCKIFLTLPGLETDPFTVQPVASHYTELSQLSIKQITIVNDYGK
jgi:hypothetical protein